MPVRAESLVVIGVGGIGLAIARRLGAGRRVVLADRSAGQLEVAVDALRAEGLEASIHLLDVTDAGQVAAFAETVGHAGPIAAVAHTSGVSPAQAPSEVIFAVDLIGAAYVIDAFAAQVSVGTAVTVIASMAGHLAELDAGAESALAMTPTAALAGLALLDPSVDPTTAYMVAKRGVQLRVQAAASSYGVRGARINSVSPGIVHTPMATEELASAYGELMQLMLDTAPTARIGTPSDIASAVAFLSSAEAAYITGTDLLVDGGVVSTKWISQG
jgi:NAD(P)-dependent dehydrogenase (short-subunit alcohol dehydrogenase family)